MPACGLCYEPHETKGHCPSREDRDPRDSYYAEVEIQPPFEWRNDHGPACCCLACVYARAERRRG